MKKRIISSIPALLFATLFGLGISSALQNPQVPKAPILSVAQDSIEIRTGWSMPIPEELLTAEYAIVKGQSAAIHHSPNRQNNLLFTFSADGFSMRPRLQGENDWLLKYQFEGIYRSGHKVICPSKSPAMKVNGEQLVQHFSEGLHIEYRNSPEGMRQNFIVENRPGGKGNLTLRLRTSGNLLPVKHENGDVALTQGCGSGSLDPPRAWYKDLKVFDVHGNRIPATMEVQEAVFDTSSNQWLSAIDLEIADHFADYPLLIDPISTGSPDATIEGGGSNNHLGWSVSSAGDVNDDGYSDVIVGAPDFGMGGAAFIYHGSPTGVIAPAAISLICTTQNAKFGISVSTAGDVDGDEKSDVIVGAEYYGNGQWHEGAAFLYFTDSIGIDPARVSRLESNNQGAQMGHSVACAGDVNGDGNSDVIVGAPYYDSLQVVGGAALLYLGRGPGLPFDTVADDIVDCNFNQGSADFGWSVASAGDLNGDGRSDVIVGAPHFDIPGGISIDPGAVWVYLGDTSGKIIKDTLLTYFQDFARMGTSVSSAGDVNGDGYSDLVIGVPGIDLGIVDQGAALVYYGSADGINQMGPDILRSDQSGSGMGGAVACAGDVNGDGYSDVIVGASFYIPTQNANGAAFIFHGKSSRISTLADDTLFFSGLGDTLFGTSVSSAGDVNGDGYSDVVVGDPNFSRIFSARGAAFVFHGAAEPIGTTQFETWGAAIKFCDVAPAGDVNGDGYSDVIAGSYISNSDSGCAFLYFGSETGIETLNSQILCGNIPSGRLAQNVSSAGDVDDDGHSDVILSAPDLGNGVFRLYYGCSTGIDMQRNFMEVTWNPGDVDLGASISSAGDVDGDGYSDVIVGAPNYSDSVTYGGAALLYRGGPAGLITSPDSIETLVCPYGSSFFGHSVASAGDINGDGFSDVIGGAPYFHYPINQSGQEKGFAMIYYGSANGIQPNYFDTLQGHTERSEFGCAVASAGDVNGDGFSDVIVGAKLNKESGNAKGSSYVYYGSIEGIRKDNFDSLSVPHNGAEMGWAVSSAGDVNGDGYSDVVVSARGYDHTSNDNGAAFLYLGTPNGIETEPIASLFGNGQGEYLGWAVASAGDVNGDGYSELLVSSFPDFSSGGGGKAFIYYGNKGEGLQTRVRQLRPSDLYTVGPGGLTETPGEVTIAMVAKSFLGRQKGKMAHEHKGNGLAFSSAGGFVTNSVGYTGISSGYTEMTYGGTVMVENIQGINGSFEYKWRSRIRFNPATAITGQMHGPWYYHKSRTPEVPMLGFKTGALCAQEIELLGNAIPIINNDSTPDLSDHSDFGQVLECTGIITHTFSIKNPGTSYLTVDTITFTGQNSTDFTVGSITFPASVAPSNGVWPITVTFDPSIVGPCTATLHVISDDCREDTFSFSIQGYGVQDTVAPAIFCPDTIRIATNTIPCSAIATWNTLLRTDNCGVTSVDSTHFSGTVFPVGDTPVTYIIADASGNQDSCSFMVQVLAPPMPVLSMESGIISTSIPNSSYQWYLDGNSIQGAIGSTFTPTLAGYYHVIGNDTNGCSITCERTYFNPGCGGGESFTIYPNPSTGKFTLRSTKAVNAPIRLEVIDVLGRKLTSLDLPDFVTKQKLDFGDYLPAGSYIMRISSGNRLAKLGFTIIR